MADQFAKAIKKISQYQHSNNIMGAAHKNWVSILESRNALDEKKILNFLDPEMALADGLGMTKNQYQSEVESTKLLFKIIEISNPGKAEFIKSTVSGENLFGEKNIDIADGVSMARSVLMNAETLFDITRVLSQYLQHLNKQKIRILEIGPGYGELCRQIVKFTDFQSYQYDLVDLPTHLILSEVYLSSIFGAESIGRSKFFEAEDFETGKTKDVIFRYFDPSELEALSESYDLIINTYSMQEMEIETAQNYSKLILEKLDPNGVFFSINASCKWDIKHYSDYHIEIFENLETSMPRQLPPSILGTVPILNVFRKAEQTCDVDIMDRLGELQKLGLTELMRAANGGNLVISSSDGPLIKAIRDCHSTDISRVNVLEAAPIELVFLIERLLSADDSRGKVSGDVLKALSCNPYFALISDITLIKLCYRSSSRYAREILKNIETKYGFVLPRVRWYKRLFSKSFA